MGSVDELRAGSRLASLMAAKTSGGTVTRVGTVAAVKQTNEYWTCDVELSGGTLTDVLMTTDCVGMQVGDRCVLQTYAHVSYVTGVLARPGALLQRVHTMLWKLPYSSDSVRFFRQGNLCIASGFCKYTDTGELNDHKVDEKIPVGYRPSTDNQTIIMSGARSTVCWFAKTNGDVYGRGRSNAAYTSCVGAWHTSDPWPES